MYCQCFGCMHRLQCKIWVAIHGVIYKKKNKKKNKHLHKTNELFNLNPLRYKSFLDYNRPYLRTFRILTSFLVDVLSDKDFLHSNLTHAHQTSHAQTHVKDQN